MSTGTPTDAGDFPEFDPDTTPFEGVQLIEASAGTGKTYNIASLVVRAIREGIPGHPTIGIDQILVVTFGEAASKELRDRVRARLTRELATETDPAIRQRLEDAVRGFDEAAIFTIHGFCQRALQENAFESGVLFDFELVPDSHALTLETADDFWWRMTQREGSDVVDMLISMGVTPSKLVELADRVPRVDGDVALVPDIQIEWADAVRDHIETYRQTASTYFNVLVAMWRQEEAHIRSLPRIRFALVHELADWMEGRRIFPGRAVLADIIEKKKVGAELFDLIRNYEQEYLRELQNAIGELRVYILREWLDYRDQELTRRKRKANALFFDDLLYQLDTAIRKGAGGFQLAKRIRAKYPLALIDEFQDTDLTQFSIFRRIYGTGRASVCLFLIGDPKQSIYGFRRADIYSYLNAQKEAKHRNTLLHNYRSEPGMVEGVNGLFTFRENPFLERDIRFRTITSMDEAGQLLVGGTTHPALNFRLVDRKQVEANRQGLIPKGPFGEFVRKHTARRIATLLNLGQAGEAVIRTVDEEEGTETIRPVEAGDVAVLVRTHLQARQMQQELIGLGVASVLQSQGGVFETPEAETLLQVLSAIESPFHQGRLRTALLSPVFGLDLAELIRMEENPGAYEGWLDTLQDYRTTWSERGFTAMFTRLLREQNVAARILLGHRGERQMTNYQHLAELLGKVDNERRGGPSGLVQWLADQAGEHGEEDERELRLESDARRVQIVTMHHAKGLEYGIVFVPYAWSIHLEPRDFPVGFFFHDDSSGHTPTWDLGTPPDQRATNLKRKRAEALAEEVRLLYVALTRAKHSCSVVWGPANNAENSALGYLLHGPNASLGELSDGDIKATLDELKRESEGTINWGLLAHNNPVTHVPNAVDDEALQTATTRRRPSLPWRISSFSALKGDRPHHEFNLPEHDDEKPPPDPEEELEAAGGFYTFPGGTQTGNLVHGVFEEIDFTAPDPEVIQAQIVKHGFDAMEEAPAVIGELVEKVLATPLLDDGFTLGELPDEQRLVELEFFFPLRLVDPKALQAFCSVPLPGQRVAGYMKGFIDLTFEHEGRFFILDYKSNHLGLSADDYGPEQLAHEMAESGYDLQYLLYTVALHRYLGSRLPDYDYDTHFGGVLYLFVRAMPDAGVYRARPDKDTILELDRILSGGQGGPA